jgi:hypothetical protein
VIVVIVVVVVTAAVAVVLAVAIAVFVVADEVLKKVPYDDIIATQRLRFGPVDEIDSTNLFTKSYFANIYLTEAHLLVGCHSALCSLLDEVRCSNVFSGAETYEVDDISISRSSILEEELTVAENGLKVRMIFLVVLIL